MERDLARWHKVSAVDTDKFESENERRVAQLELQANEDERAVLETMRLLSRAYHYGLPLPNGDVWDTSLRGNRQMLRRETLGQLRTAVRNEEKERWQYWDLRFKVIIMLMTSTAGVIGTLIGLVAVWNK